MSGIDSVPSEVWTKVSQQPGPIKPAAFGAAIIHGVLMSRQMFGCRGMSQLYPIGSVQLTQAVEFLCNTYLTGGEVPDIKTVVSIIAEV